MARSVNATSVPVHTVLREFRSSVTRAPRGFVDGEGWARDAGGTPLALLDGCGAYDPALNATDANATTTVDYPLLAITSKWGYKYFHWLVEVLPRVALLMDVEPSLGAPCPGPGCPGPAALAEMTAAGEPPTHLPRLLVHCKSPVVRQSLVLLGINRRRVLCWKLGHTVRTTAYLLWPQASPCGGVQSHAAHLLRHAALPRGLRPVTDAQQAAAGAVLLHRRTGKRQLANHDAVYAALRAYLELEALTTQHATTPLAGAAKESRRGAARLRAAALATVVDGSGTLRAQIESFRAARCQVGPHGAGLSLMLFAPPTFGTAEITPGAYFVRIRGKPGEHLNRNHNRSGRAVLSQSPNACFQGLAATLGMRHEWVVVRGATANEDLAPDPELVAQLARAVCPRPLDRAWALA